MKQGIERERERERNREKEGKEERLRKIQGTNGQKNKNR